MAPPKNPRGTARVRHRFLPMLEEGAEAYARKLFGDEAVDGLPRYLTTGGGAAMAGRMKGILQWYVVIEKGTWQIPVSAGKPKNPLKPYDVGDTPLVFVTLSIHSGLKTALLRRDDAPECPDTYFHSRS